MKLLILVAIQVARNTLHKYSYMATNPWNLIIENILIFIIIEYIMTKIFIKFCYNLPSIFVLETIIYQIALLQVCFLYNPAHYRLRSSNSD